MNKFILILATLLSFAAHAVEPDLKAYMATGVNYLDRSNIRWNGQAKGAVCDAMKSVGLGCSYNDRVALTDYLLKNGANLFPCAGNTNPYTNNKLPVGDVGNCSNRRPDEDDNVYIGQAQQNAILAATIAKNKQLFQKGNLTAVSAKKWRM